jgi:2-oxoglutarate ferredoxin oxidoreductase subunit alpha
MAKEKASTELARNTVTLGVAAGLTGFGLESMESVIRQNFARKGQASDHFLATSVRDVELEALDFDAVTIDRGELLSDAELDVLQGEYKRHVFTESGISPRAIPGHPKAVYATSSDEHDEYGHIEEDAENRRRMTDKRMGRLEKAVEEMWPPTLYGRQKADFTFVGCVPPGAPAVVTLAFGTR